ncbi:1,5-anhydro-D-fructose reductase-like [Toxorhynchites rutilus septentrionalis]|uniref:1,5-anhydro-D-fructose reductase-like n=1 Tax=Toxorhynchites rutilus septentrionalis TaxID=329112 RepID=UPI002479A237|nr:1,5-anhydro-D-fructose reductase-like [Toxorhynchites rutilus septentrionalis]
MLGQILLGKSPPNIPTIKLNNGQQMPVIGLGTWLSKEGEAIEAVKSAIDEGYRHIDTAYFYQNEKEVGEAIRAKIEEGVIQRKDLFVTTKLWNTYHHPDHVERAFQQSFENLNIDYIDLYLMHLPIGYKFVDWDSKELMPYDADGKLEFSNVDFVDTWKAMEKLIKTGKVKGIGVSNFNSEQITRLLAECEIKPATNQVECNPSLNQKKLIEFCRNLGIAVTAYSPLGRPYAYVESSDSMPKPLLDDPKVVEIGKRYDKSAAQVVLRYLVEIGTIPIPKSSNPKRIKENLKIFDFRLKDDEIKVMDEFNTGQRTVPFKLCVDHKYYPFNIEF